MSDTQTIAFGGGCFWCTEAVFKKMKGVHSVVPGYAGGHTADPTYEQVCGGDTGHVEVVKVEYDPKEVSVEELLTVFFGSHDPTTENRQGNDVGTQYRSVVFYTTQEQRAAAIAMIESINTSSMEGDEVVTSVEPLPTFYEAEEYHHDYFANNPGNPYCSVVIAPKLKKVQEKYAALLKEIYE